MGEINRSPSAGGPPPDGARAFLLSRIHPAIWVSCLGYFAPVPAMFILDGPAGRASVFGLSFLSAAFLLISGASVALWRMSVHRRAIPAGPHYAGRLVALVNLAMGVGAFMLFSAVPSGHSPIARNESAAIYHLRDIANAQLQFQLHVVIDLDADRIGEFGTLGELAGTEAVRGTGELMTQSPYLPRFLGTRHPDTAYVKRAGYLFALYLPSRALGTVIHPPGAGSAPAVTADADLQEQHWAAYAWPLVQGETGERAFFINELGEVYACRNTRTHYSGPASAPAPGAMFTSDGGAAGPLAGTVGDRRPLAEGGSSSHDGEVWYPAQD